jgi:hypothetical protein
MVLVAATFLYPLDHTWQPRALHWVRARAGKLGTPSDLDDPYLLLAGLAAGLSTAAALAFVRVNPFP